MFAAVAIAACSTPLTVEEEAFCDLMEQLDVYGDREPADLPPTEFEALQREQERVLSESVAVAPDGLKNATRLVAEATEAINEAYASIGFDLARMEDIDSDQLTNIIRNFPESQVNNASAALDEWVGRNC